MMNEFDNPLYLEPETGRALSRHWTNTKAVAPYVLALAPPVAAWSFLTPVAAMCTTLGYAVAFIPTDPRPLGFGLGAFMATALALTAQSERRTQDPATVPTVINATMNEVCLRAGASLLVTVPTPSEQSDELQASGITRMVGPSYSQHVSPDPSVQWIEPYVLGTKRRNPFYTADLQAPTTSPGMRNGMKSYRVTIDTVTVDAKGDSAASYTVRYSYKDFWRGKPVQAQKQFTTGLNRTRRSVAALHC